MRDEEMIGQIISHYKILEKLGEGGMGVVYKAHDNTLDRVVALKFLPNYLTSDPTEKQRFYHEAKAASALNHTNITTIYEISEFEGQLFIAMELVEGKTLKQLVEHEILPVKTILDIAIQVCDGMAAAHEKGIVHRDIKSENIMVTPKGQAKIMDFGLAKVKGATKLTKESSTLGTAAYMSPEQAQGEEVDLRSDIFSFGVVLYELLTGKLPFKGEHHAALMYSIVNEEPSPVARFNEKVGPEIERIVTRALAKDREERYQHADELLAEIRHERKKLEYAKAEYVAAEGPSVSHKPKRRWMRMAAVGVGILIVVILAILFNPFHLKIGVQESVASQRQSLTVIQFENIPDPTDKEYIGEMLTNLLITALFETKDLNIISRERLYDKQKEMGQGETKAISPSTASQITRRAGVSSMLLGSIIQVQPSLTVTYRVVDVQTGKIESTKRLSGYQSDKIFSLVDTLALMVKNDLNVVPSAATSAKSVVDVTTNSPEAYRAYIEGVELFRKLLFYESRIAFRKAIELDRNFAMAHYCYVRGIDVFFAWFCLKPT
jgi:serine/threonine protein kinase